MIVHKHPHKHGQPPKNRTTHRWKNNCDETSQERLVKRLDDQVTVERTKTRGWALLVWWTVHRRIPTENVETYRNFFITFFNYPYLSLLSLFFLSNIQVINCLGTRNHRSKASRSKPSSKRSAASGSARRRSAWPRCRRGSKRTRCGVALEVFGGFWGKKINWGKMIHEYTWYDEIIKCSWILYIIIWRDLKNSYHESYTKCWNYFWCSDFTSSLWGGTQLNQVLPHVGARKSARLALAFCDICMFNVQFCTFLHANGRNMNINIE